MSTLKSYLLSETDEAAEIVEKRLRATKPADKVLPGVATGAGDSYAAALFTQFASDGRVIAADPVHILNAPPDWARTILGFSVKGRTVYVAEAMKALKARGARAVAFTASPNSPVGSLGDDVVELVYSGGEHPVGVGNYLAELAAAWAYLGNEAPKGFPRPPTVSLARAREVIAVGEGYGFVNALFLCLKLYEAACMPCRYYEAEQFLHAPIYSISKGSVLVIFEHPGGVRAGDGADIARSAGLRHHVVEAGGDGLATAYVGTLAAARAAAAVADNMGFRRPCFITKKKLREASTPSIYGRGGR